MSGFTHLLDLASERLGGRVLAANDEFFAPKESLLKSAAPVFIEGKYTNRGKWMDGWETRRRRTPGHDWCIARLGLAGIIRGVVVDTSFFKGNFPERCSVEACAVEGSPSPLKIAADATRWIQILPETPLRGDARNEFPIACPWRFTHLRLKIYPDGGVARLRVHGEVVPDALPRRGEMNLVAVENGGRVLDASDMFFSHPSNLLMSGRAKNMGDGWETRRRRGPGHDWVVLALGVAGEIRRTEVETTHFKGNFPESCSLDACNEALDSRRVELNSLTWQELLPRTNLGPDRRHNFVKELQRVPETTHVRFNIFPDGGVARLRIWGVPSPDGRRAFALRLLNALVPETAARTLSSCCGSRAWAERMAAARPFESAAHLMETADRVWAELCPDDWREAFCAHPRIGGKKAAGKASAKSREWSRQEQSAMAQTASRKLRQLAEANRAYEARFGHIFLICASGKSAAEMLAALRVRLENTPETELRIAAEEQRKITRLRLERLMES